MQSLCARLEEPDAPAVFSSELSLLRRSSYIHVRLYVIVPFVELFLFRTQSLRAPGCFLSGMSLLVLGITHHQLLVDIEALAGALDGLLLVERLLDLAHETWVAAHSKLEVVELDLLAACMVGYSHRLEANALDEVGHDLVQHPHRLGQRRLAVAVRVEELRYYS